MPRTLNLVCGMAASILAATGGLPAFAQGQSPMIEAPGAAPPPATQEIVEAPWQDAITGQIQAFRDHDASAAFGYAGASFQTTFQNAEVFFEAIVNSGYAPIMESRSHSFGAYQLTDEGGVIQEVRFAGKDQELYTAIYQLTEEPSGWRVQGVQLLKQAGIAV